MQALVLPWTTCLSRAVTLVMESSSPQRCLWVSCLWAWPLGCSSLRPQGKKWWSESGRAKLVYDRPILPDHTMVKCCPQVSRFLPGGALGLGCSWRSHVDVGKFDVPIHHQIDWPGLRPDRLGSEQCTRCASHRIVDFVEIRCMLSAGTAQRDTIDSVSLDGPLPRIMSQAPWLRLYVVYLNAHLADVHSCKASGAIDVGLSCGAWWVGDQLLDIIGLQSHQLA